MICGEEEENEDDDDEYEATFAKDAVHFFENRTVSRLLSLPLPRLRRAKPVAEAAIAIGMAMAMAELQGFNLGLLCPNMFWNYTRNTPQRNFFIIPGATPLFLPTPPLSCSSTY